MTFTCHGMHRRCIMHQTSHKFLPLTGSATIKYRKLLTFIRPSSLFKGQSTHRTPPTTTTTTAPSKYSSKHLSGLLPLRYHPIHTAQIATLPTSTISTSLTHARTHALAKMGEPADVSTTSTSTSTPTITITVEFTGGLEMLFDNIPSHHVKLPAKNTQGQVATIGDLIPWLCENLMRDTRKELFVLDGNV